MIQISEYGNAAMYRGECPSCEDVSLIIDGVHQCCDEPAKMPKRAARKKECGAVRKRKLPSKAEQDRILESQERRCLYCGLAFGELVARKSGALKMTTLRICWDHFTPWVHTYDNAATNFVAACQICNAMKGSLVFENKEQAIQKIRDKWSRRWMSL